MDRAKGLSIGTLSKHTGVNIETIRYYERIGVMPLPPDVVTIPLALHERETGERLEAEQKIALLNRARAMTLGWLWLLVFSAWRLGSTAGGPWAGRLASGLIAADPNFLAHASLATTAPLRGTDEVDAWAAEQLHQYTTKGVEAKLRREKDVVLP